MKRIREGKPRRGRPPKRTGGKRTVTFELDALTDADLMSIEASQGLGQAAAIRWAIFDCANRLRARRVPDIRDKPG